MSPPAGIPEDNDTKLYTISGMTGLIEHGDELMVMVYGASAREADLRLRNLAAAQSSLKRWLAQGKGHQTVLDERFLRVPDLDDQSGSRFYYFERDNVSEDWQFRAICAGAWDDDPAWPSTCDLSYPFGSRVVSIELKEPTFLRRHSEIVDRVLIRLTADGIIRR